MSLLDKQEVQDIYGHTALRARKWSGFIRKRASEDTTLALGLLKKKEESQIAIFYFARCCYYSDVIHSFDWKSAIEHNGGVLNA